MCIMSRSAHSPSLRLAVTGGCRYQPFRNTRDIILGDDALLYIVYVMLILATAIPTTRWSYSRPPADSNDCRLQLHLVAGIRAAQIKYRRFNAECIVSLV